MPVGFVVFPEEVDVDHHKGYRLFVAPRQPPLRFNTLVKIGPVRYAQQTVHSRQHFQPLIDAFQFAGALHDSGF